MIYSTGAIDMKKILRDIVNGKRRAVGYSHLMLLTFKADTIIVADYNE